MAESLRKERESDGLKLALSTRRIYRECVLIRGKGNDVNKETY